MRNAAYWALTILFCLALGGGGVADVLLLDDVVEITDHLGYPRYFVRMLGIWKLLGAAALLAPATARLKEWAYAGFAFDLIGATVSHVQLGDSTQDAVVPMVLLALGAMSYCLRPDERRVRVSYA